jgi:hypothetical protein
LYLAQQLLDFEPGLGKWRHSKTGKDIIFPTKPLEKRITHLTQLPQKTIITHPLSIQEEYNTEYICKDIIEKHNIILIRAKYAGSGKSYICEYMRELGHKVLFICPTNELAEKYGKDGLTINKLFGFGVTEEEQKFMKKFNADEYDTIVFDEIFFNNVKILARISNYVKNNPENIIIATGDTHLEKQCAVVQKFFNRLKKH